MTVRAAPKPSPRLKEPKRLESHPHRIPDKVRAQAFAMWGTTCMWCGQPGGRLDLHHIVRRSQGGKDVPEILWPLHRLCHRYVHEHPTEAKARGFLA